MAVTFSTDSYWDAAGRIAGEAVTINSNATVTIRTDTRWYPSAPASMTGTIASVSVSTTQGGKMKIDGTKVRWMAFDTGSGNVPAIGTTITQGGVSGYLLAVYTSITSAPTAVGAAMPSSGFIKFREVTGGAFSAGALSGIGANASSADVTGWIEVVFDSSASQPLNFGQLGTFETSGAWFDLGTTSGSAQQIISVPTNGGTGGLSGIQIETSPGSGVYEWYSGQYTDQQFTTAKIATDRRGRFFCSDWANSRIIIGGDGTNAIGYVPASGCKIRMPNILVRIATSAARATNLKNAANASMAKSGFSTGTFAFNVSKCHCEVDLNHLTNAGSFTMSDSVFDGRKMIFENISAASTATNCLFMINGQQSTVALFGVNNNQSAITFTNCMSMEVEPSLLVSPAGIRKSTSISLISHEHFHLNFQSSNLAYGFYFDGTVNCSVDGFKLIGPGLMCTTNKGLSVKNIDVTHLVVGTTGTTGGRYGVVTQNNIDFLLDGMTICLNNTITNAHPYQGIVQINGTLGKNSIRNIGSRSSFLVAGSANICQYLIRVEAGTKSTKVQRCYMDNTGTQIIGYGGATSTIDCTIEHVMSKANGGGSFTPGGISVIHRSIGASAIAGTGIASNYGIHWIDGFYATAYTTGKVVWYGSKPSAATSGENYIYSPGGTSRYLAPAGQVMLNTVGDYFYSEITYFMLGHDTLANTAPVIAGTNTNLVTFEYQIDTGSGWNGTWKTLDAATLSAETISPSGFKIKIRGTLTSSGTAQITSIILSTTSSQASQTNYLYTLDTASITLTGLIAGSEVRAYAGTDPSTATEIGGTEGTGGTTFTFQHSAAGQDGHIVILAMGYQPIYLPYTYTSTDASILIQPVIDRNYNNPA